MRVVELARQPALISVGAARSLTKADAFKTMLLNALAGSTVTLPPAIGSGDEYECVVSVLATSNSHKIQVANSVDVMRGLLRSIDTDSADAVGHFAAAAASDTITLNRGTTGSVLIGERFWFKDVFTGIWLVDGFFGATGVPATPFSAAV